MKKHFQICGLLCRDCFSRLRVVSNFGDGDCGAGKIHTRAREISRRRDAKGAPKIRLFLVFQWLFVAIVHYSVTLPFAGSLVII